MNRRAFTCGAIVLLALGSDAATAADSGSITFEPGIDFRALKTFALRAGSIQSQEPEINNRLFRQRMDDSLRSVLKKKGLTEVEASPDITVTWAFADRDIEDVQRTPPLRVPPIPGQQPGFVLPGSEPRSVHSTEGMLAIDIYNATGGLLWRGTRRNRERTPSALSRQLSEDARKLIGKYPPRGR